MELRRTSFWQKSPILDSRTVSKGNPLRMPMDVTNLEEFRCKYDVLIMAEALKVAVNTV